MLIKSLLTPPSTLIDFLSLKIKGILKLSFGLYPQVGYIVIVLSFRTENRINIDQNYRSGDVCLYEFPIVSVKLFYWLEYFIQRSRTSLSDRSQFVAICVVWSLVRAWHLCHSCTAFHFIHRMVGCDSILMIAFKNVITWSNLLYEVLKRKIRRISSHSWILHHQHL